MIDTHDPNLALDRLLALRPEDLDGWEAEAALEAEDRADEEALDALFGEVLAGWAAHDLGEPDVTGPILLERATPPAPPARSWLQPAALAASVALVAFATWQLQPPADTGLKSLVTAEESSRVHLQFAVERTVDGRVVVEPGADGAELTNQDAIAMRLGLQGATGYLTLFEVDGTARGTVLYPLDGEPTALEAGITPLRSDAGDDLVYRPDAAGTYRYVAIVTDEPIDATLVLQDVLEAGDSRPDLWPRHVLSVDSFTASWSD